MGLSRQARMYLGNGTVSPCEITATGAQLSAHQFPHQSRLPLDAIIPVAFTTPKYASVHQFLPFLAGYWGESVLQTLCPPPRSTTQASMSIFQLVLILFVQLQSDSRATCPMIGEDPSETSVAQELHYLRRNCRHVSTNEYQQSAWLTDLESVKLSLLLPLMEGETFQSRSPFPHTLPAYPSHHHQQRTQSQHHSSPPQHLSSPGQKISETHLNDLHQSAFSAS